MCDCSHQVIQRCCHGISSTSTLPVYMDSASDDWDSAVQVRMYVFVCVWVGRGGHGVVFCFLLKVTYCSSGGSTDTSPGEPDGGKRPQPSHGYPGRPGGPGVLIPA